MKKLVAAGMEINDVPADTITEFRKVAHSVYPEAVKDFGPMGKEVVDMLVFFNK
jgi:TRAP-type C4-dicarboxylate transport system substrate-binding protein